MYTKLALLTPLAVAALLFPATAATAGTAAAVQPPGPVGPIDHSPDDVDVFPAGYPVARFEVPAVIRTGRLVEIRLDASTGDIVSQQVRVDGPDGWWVIIREDEPPGPDCWVGFSVVEPGAYLVTLTVTGPDGTEHSRSQETLALPPLRVVEFDPTGGLGE